MSTLDYIIIGFLLFLVIRGIFRGFVREIFSLAGVIAGLWLGIHYQLWLINIMKRWFPLPQYLPLAGFILIFFAALIIFNLLGWSLKLLIKNALTGWFDKCGGMVLAMLKGLLLCSIILIIFTIFFPAEKTPFIGKSLLAPKCIKTYQQVTEVIDRDHYKNLKVKLTGEQKKTNDLKPDQSKPPVKKNE
jgi:membrane protein required for colicin V production